MTTWLVFNDCTFRPSREREVVTSIYGRPVILQDMALFARSGNRVSCHTGVGGTAAYGPDTVGAEFARIVGL